MARRATSRTSEPPRKAKTDLDALADEPFMGPAQRAWFSARLREMEQDILRGSIDTLAELKEQGQLNSAELADRASLDINQTLELRVRDRERKLLVKIREALDRIAAGTYGYCEVTGEPIPIARLDARPTATLGVAAQEAREREQKLRE